MSERVRGGGGMDGACMHAKAREKEGGRDPLKGLFSAQVPSCTLQAHLAAFIACLPMRLHLAQMAVTEAAGRAGCVA